MQGFKIKSLVWFPAPSICTREKAEALGGHYSVVEFDAGTSEAHFATNIDLGGLAFVFILEPDPLGGRRPKRYPTIEAAKAAAQADYEARVLAAIEAPVQEPVGWTGNGSLMAVQDGREGYIFKARADAHPIPLYTAPQPDETAALRAKLAEVKGVRDLLSKSWLEFNDALRKAEADRDEERKLADDLAKAVEPLAFAKFPTREEHEAKSAVLARHAARRKEQQG